MKIKKKTNLVMAAASVVAIVGVASVSFAAWTGSNTALTAQAETGNVTLLGFDSVEPGAFDKNVVPYNQPDGTYNATDCATVVSYKLPDFTVYEDYTISAVIEETTFAQTDYAIYVQYGEQVTAAPASFDGWTRLAVKTADTDYVVIENGLFTNAVNNKVAGEYLNLILVSEAEVDSISDLAGKTFTIGLKLETKNA